MILSRIGPLVTIFCGYMVIILNFVRDIIDFYFGKLSANQDT